MSGFIYGRGTFGPFFVFSAICLLGWWLTLAIQDPTLLDGSNVYHALAKIAPAPVWATACLILGIIQLTALFTVRPSIQAIAALLTAFWWGMIAGGFWSLPHPSTAANTYTALALANLWGGIVTWKAR